MRSPRAFLVASFAALLAAGSASAAPPQGLDKIQHVVVIYLENHSFDNMFGLFPGADGLLGKAGWAPQIDANGKPYDTLPRVIETDDNPPVLDPRFPANMINAPFMIDQYVPEDQKTGDLVHRFYQEQVQIDGGKNDKFALVSDAKGLVMGFYDTRGTRLWKYAQEFTLADHYFMGAFGGSSLNHFWLACACAPAFKNAPTRSRPSSTPPAIWSRTAR